MIIVGYVSPNDHVFGTFIEPPRRRWINTTVIIYLAIEAIGKRAKRVVDAEANDRGLDGILTAPAVEL